MSKGATRQLPEICRIYKNSSDKVIAIDKITINLCTNTLNAGPRDNSGDLIQKFDVYVDTLRKHRTLLHLETGGSRVVATIQMIGTYDSLQENSGNFLIATYNANTSAFANDVEVSFEPIGVAKVGDAV